MSDTSTPSYVSPSRMQFLEDLEDFERTCEQALANGSVLPPIEDRVSEEHFAGYLRRLLDCLRRASVVPRLEEYLPRYPGREQIVKRVFEDSLSIDGYKIVQKLNEGGMGVVYLAQQVTPSRPVALKILRPEFLAHDGVLKRFQNEPELMGSLHHPNIVHIYHAGKVSERPYFTLEYCDGGNLADSLDGKPIPPEQAAQLIETLAKAIQFLHENDILHRDLKPANVLYMKDGTLKITDFGLAKQLGASSDVTQLGERLGTPSYMAPEQAGGEAADIGAEMDVHALGAILYEMLTGKPPFKGPTVHETIEQVRQQRPVPPRELNGDVPRQLESICLKCLEKKPTDRYRSAVELATELRDFLTRKVPANDEDGQPKDEVGLKSGTENPTGLALSPEDASAALDRGIASLERGSFKDAKAEFDKAAAGGCDSYILRSTNEERLTFLVCGTDCNLAGIESLPNDEAFGPNLVILTEDLEFFLSISTLLGPYRNGSLLNVTNQWGCSEQSGFRQHIEVFHSHGWIPVYQNELPQSDDPGLKVVASEVITMPQCELSDKESKNWDSQITHFRRALWQVVDATTGNARKRLSALADEAKDRLGNIEADYEMRLRFTVLSFMSKFRSRTQLAISLKDPSPSMPRSLFVGGLPPDVDDDRLRDMFSEFGNVISANVIMDRYTGSSRNFGFVEMDKDEVGRAAIDELDGKDMPGGMTLNLREKWPENPPIKLGLGHPRQSSGRQGRSY